VVLDFGLGLGLCFLDHLGLAFLFRLARDRGRPSKMISPRPRPRLRPSPSKMIKKTKSLSLGIGLGLGLGLVLWFQFSCFVGFIFLVSLCVLVSYLSRCLNSL
jgi:hypothetical protein